MPFNIRLEVLDKVDSTNSYAIGQIRANLAENGMAWMALQQHAGKGRNGNVWKMVPGEALALSIALETHCFNQKDLFILSMATALAVKKFIGTYVEDVYIKWPNDIVVGEKKIAGILIENLWQQQNWNWAVVGIGINLYNKNFPKDLPYAESLQNMVPNKILPNLTESAFAVLENLKFYLTDFVNNPSEIVLAYNEALWKREANIEYLIEGGKQTGKLIGVNPNGTIIINNNGTKLFNLDQIKINLNA
jgi:BirA family transcriptional regulator, biotin operon repressor / biotin---[acetyl-CoA-carboxylase] ligase